MAINYNYNNVGHYNTDGKAQDVLISGNTAYVADGSSGLQIVDVSDPTNSTLSSTYAGGNYEQLSDLSALTQTSYSGTFALFGISELTAVYDPDKGWDVLDTTNPSQPYSLAQLGISFPSEFSTSTDAYISGDYTYVADGVSGLQIALTEDVADSAMNGSDIPLTTYDTPGSASGIFVEGNFAYVADGEFGLQIIDVTTPTSPSLVGSYDTVGTATDVFVEGNFAYVADDSGLAIIDVSDLSAPTATYIYETDQVTSGVSVYGNYVYVTERNAGLKALNFIKSSTGDDSLLGNDDIGELMLGSSGADELEGLRGADVLAGGAEKDTLLGGGGADTMVGGMGNDSMIGGNGDDVLIGVNPYEANPGVGERDFLRGSAGADTFVLGDEMNVFYHDNGTTEADGYVSLARIKDFTLGEDLIQLSGSKQNYELLERNGSTRIFETSGAARDYIAIVSGVTGLADSSFEYVGNDNVL